jgi:S1-C subfamily serine protease
LFAPQGWQARRGYIFDCNRISRFEEQRSTDRALQFSHVAEPQLLLKKFYCIILDQQTRAQLNIPVNVRGALVTEVDPNAAAYEAGLRTGNVILQIGDKPVTDAQDPVTETTKRTGNITLVSVWSREGIHYLTVRE